MDPIEGQFFTTEALGGLSDALVREAVQNSLDAALPDEQVRVSITFSSSDKQLNIITRDRYLKGLWSHIVCKNAGIIEVPQAGDRMDFILFEDFGTRGLEGDIKQDEDTDMEAHAPKNDFFYFWRNIGRAVEGSTLRGRWGLGKTVFQAASRINSFFGLTVRRSDARTLLMGQSVLKIHRLNGQKHAPYGYFGSFEDDFAVPTEDRRHVKQFCKEFSLERSSESGLSIVIPFPDQEINPKEIVRSVIHHYFFPILAGDLVVTVRQGQWSEVVKGSQILPLVARAELPDKHLVQRRLELAKWGLELAEKDYELLEMPEEGRAPKWDDSLFDVELLNRLRKKFDQGDRIALKVPLWVKRKHERTHHSFFRVLLERDGEAERGEDIFIREGVTISGVSSMRERGVRVIVLVTDKSLSRLLGDSENPAHTEWQERSPKFKGKYDRGPSCLRFVKNSTREIVRVLTRPAEGRDKTLLTDLFYIDTSPQEKPRGTKDKPTDASGADGQDKPDPNVLTRDQFLQLQRVKGGFRLSRHPTADRLPKVIFVHVAYDVRRGNPFRRYQPFDFELNKLPIQIESDGAKVTAKFNTLEVVLQSQDFRVAVKGFDHNRDLRIKTSTSLDGAL